MTNENSFVLNLTGLTTVTSKQDTKNEILIATSIQPSSSTQKDGGVRRPDSFTTSTVDPCKNTDRTGIII